MPAGTPDVSVDGEWSFAQTLRHLVMATDTWLGGAILGLEAPYHPIGRPTPSTPPTATTRRSSPLASRRTTTCWRCAPKAAQVRELLAVVTAADLDVERRNPWSPEYPETTRSCLHTILEEEWEHHRYAVRDLDAITG